MVAHYGLSRAETLDLPVNTFWMMFKLIDRHEAESDLRLLRALISANSKEGFESLSGALTKKIDQRPEPARDDELDREGLAELKRMAG